MRRARPSGAASGRIVGTMPPTPEQATILAFQTAARRLRLQVEQSIRSGAIATAVGRERQLADVLTTLRALGGSITELSLSTAASGYLLGVRATEAAGSVPATAASFKFTGSHLRTVQTLAANMAGRLSPTVAVVGRRVDDAFRRVGLEQVAAGVAAGSGRREVSLAIGEALIRESVTDAVTGFVDARGARWQLDTYAEMVARTTTREAMSAGTNGRMRETGQVLITITSHPHAADICTPYDGQTFALPGTTHPDYETIDELPPFHPNCEHVATPAAGNAEAFLRSLEA